MPKPRLSAFPAALFLAGLGLSLYYGNEWWALPNYSEADIAESVELNLALDLQRDRSPDMASLEARRAVIDSELRAQINGEQRDIQNGLAAGLVTLLLSLAQMVWMRRLRPEGD